MVVSFFYNLYFVTNYFLIPTYLDSDVKIDVSILLIGNNINIVIQQLFIIIVC